jgi:hypothetical protein
MSFKSFFKIFEKFSKVISFDVTHPEETMLVGGTRYDIAAGSLLAHIESSSQLK